MPVLARAHRDERLRSLLAAWLVALLVIAPFARPYLPVDLAAAAPAAADELAARAGEHKRPPAGLLSAPPLPLGILARPPLVETALGPPPVKLPLLRPAADQPLLAYAGAPAQAGALKPVFQRSAVGTARTPTGPPA